MNQQRRFRLITFLFFVMVALIGAGVSSGMADGKVMSLTLVQGSGPSLVLLPKQ
ncbi:MAG TPA: hypothetical protein VMZ30_21775 [Pyrinomonadaceae bacterium]|nr:hypothetical protein [Pyrinomonadaceae bacterium]